MTDTPQGPSTAQFPAPTGAVPAVPQPHAIPASQLFDQLARIEDKASRIEDKYARSEALLSRVEDKIDVATGRMVEAARQADLAALRQEVRGLSERTRRLPGKGALVTTVILTALLTAALTVAAQRLDLDRLLAPVLGTATTTR